ncbi:MAG: HEAT repeat domain-containing protein, partial [Methanospirillaceae archaeon]|nr:HEAT repeat domain-containing protein [Methanospirillaceae archaeon]
MRDSCDIEEILKRYDTGIGTWFHESLSSASLQDLPDIARILDWAGCEPLGEEKKIRYYIGKENWKQVSLYGLPAASLLLSLFIRQPVPDNNRISDVFLWFSPGILAEALTRTLKDPKQGPRLISLLTSLTTRKDQHLILAVIRDKTLPSHDDCIAALIASHQALSPWLSDLLKQSSLSSLHLVTPVMRELCIYPSDSEARVLYWYGEGEYEYLNFYGDTVLSPLFSRIQTGSSSDIRTVLSIAGHYPVQSVISCLFKVLREPVTGKEIATMLSRVSDQKVQDYLVRSLASQSVPEHEELMEYLNLHLPVVGDLVKRHLLTARYEDLPLDVYLMNRTGARPTSLLEQIAYAIGSYDWNTVIGALPITGAIRRDELVSLLTSRLPIAAFDELTDISELLRRLYRYPEQVEARILYWCGQQDWNYLPTFGNHAIVPLLRLFPSADSEAQSAISQVLMSLQPDAVGNGLVAAVADDPDDIIIPAFFTQKDQKTAEYLITLFSSATLSCHDSLCALLKARDNAGIRWLTSWITRAPFESLPKYASLLRITGWYPVGAREKARYAIGTRDWSALCVSRFWQEAGSPDALGEYLSSLLFETPFPELAELSKLLSDIGYQVRDLPNRLYYAAGMKDWDALREHAPHSIDIVFDLAPSADPADIPALLGICDSFPDYLVAERIYPRLQSPRTAVILADSLTSVRGKTVSASGMRIWTALWHQYPLELRTMLTPCYNRLLSWMEQVMDAGGMDILQETVQFFSYMQYQPSGARSLLYAVGMQDRGLIERSGIPAATAFRIYAKSTPAGRRTLMALLKDIDGLDTDLLDQATEFVSNDCASPSDSTIHAILSLVKKPLQLKETDPGPVPGEVRAFSIRDYLCSRSDEMDDESFIKAGRIIRMLGAEMEGICRYRDMILSGAHEALARELMDADPDEIKIIFSVLNTYPAQGTQAFAPVIRHLSGEGEGGWRRILLGVPLIRDKRSLDSLISALSYDYIPSPPQLVRARVTDWILDTLPNLFYSTLQDAVMLIDRYNKPYYPDSHPSAVYYWLGKKEWGVVKQAVQISGDLQPLFLALENESSSTKKALIQMLGQQGDKDACSRLVLYLKDVDPDIRALAAWAIGQYQGGEFIPHLIGSLSDPYMVARENALVTLMHHDTRVMVRGIVAGITNDMEIGPSEPAVYGTGILDTLPRILDLEAVNFLLFLLTDESAPGHNQLIALLLQNREIICTWLSFLPQEN